MCSALMLIYTDCSFNDFMLPGDGVVKGFLNVIQIVKI